MIAAIIIGYIILCIILRIFFPDLGEESNSTAKDNNKPEKPKSVFSYYSYKAIADDYAKRYGVKPYSDFHTVYSAQEFRSALLRMNIVAAQSKKEQMIIFEDTISDIKLDTFNNKPTIILGDGHYYSLEGHGDVQEKFKFYLADDSNNMDTVSRLRLTDKVMLIGILRFSSNTPFFVGTTVVKVNGEYLPYFEDIVTSSQ